VVSVLPLVESPRLSLCPLLEVGIACRPADGGVVVVLLASRCNIKQGVHGTGEGWNPIDRRASERVGCPMSDVPYDGKRPDGGKQRRREHTEPHSNALLFWRSEQSECCSRRSRDVGEDGRLLSSGPSWLDVKIAWAESGAQSLTVTHIYEWALELSSGKGTRICSCLINHQRRFFHPGKRPPTRRRAPPMA
jgi:hypothetical protein